MASISFHPLAERELNDTARYYDLESPGLGRAFLDAVRSTCVSISDHPQSGTLIAGAIRRRLIRRFPYGLLYSMRPGGIRILAVMSLKRRPAYWVGRE